MASPPPDDLALAAQVADLRGDLAAVKAQIADLRGDLATIKARLELLNSRGTGALGRQVADLTEAVAGFLGDGAHAEAPNWRGLSTEDYSTQLAVLREWVADVLAVNYLLPGTLPSCWADHPMAVWELSTLRAEWRRIYDRKRPDLAGALTWHDRWLPGAVGRIEKHLLDCKGGPCAAAMPLTPPLPALG